MEVMPLLHLRLSLKQRYALLALVIVGMLVFGSHLTRNRGAVRFTNRKLSLNAESPQFTLGGEPFRILGGSIHYFRVPRASWEDRLLKLKACGFNTVTTYVPWNAHEPRRGVFNYEDDLDLEAYLHLAASLELWVILRPGPYICSEWEFGGIPSWLLQDPKMRVRTTYKGFTSAVNSFFDDLIKRVEPYQYSKGGPIIALQVENEYGAYAKDETYMAFVKEALLSRGIAELLMTSDNVDGLNRGGVKGVLETVNFNKLTSDHLIHLDGLQPQRPKMVMEFWPGWFDLWGEHHHTRPENDVIAEVTKILNTNMSMNFYMFHGGTNFGFMNGAAATGNTGSTGMVTSYDYDAPLSEAGDYSIKYLHLRKLFSSFHTEPLLDLPPLQERSVYEAVVIQQHFSLWDSLDFSGTGLTSQRPVNMENLPVNDNNGQSYGYTLYETTIARGGSLNAMNNVRDRALVFLDRRFVGVLDYTTQRIDIPDVKTKRILSLLVENCGRVNYGTSLDDQRKGLIGDITLNQMALRDFIIYSLDMMPGFIKRLETLAEWKSMDGIIPTFPCFFRGTFYVNDVPKDTFIMLPGWSKGVVFINGKNLGRYWSIGPQQTLYLPASWLHSGTNKVILFEEKQAAGPIQFTKIPDYNTINKLL
ncbi:beta-galactosidase-1-like protein 2 [Brachionichthys hirsutus]|uniref:beta-galactosidase-1-like protein 2 n=1 Tax=Brachionichthys hirsutus TaxID=412623 RepID=UPI00360444FB